MRLSAAGFAATLVTYGPARMGFGLFLPQFRSAFDLSTEMAGFIASLGFCGLLLGLMAAHALSARWGPRLPVLVGLSAATSGMGLVAAAPGVTWLVFGVVVAMSSAGLCWSPFNDAVHHRINSARRPAALSVISTGTSLGIAAAGAIALLLSFSGGSWRIAWTAFAVFGAVVLLANGAGLRHTEGVSGSVEREWAVLWQGPVAPLYAVALSFGTTSAIYISFAADRVEGAGGLPTLPAGASSALIFVSYGIFGLLGLATGQIREEAGRAGLLGLLFTLSALSLFLIAAAPTFWAAIILSSGLQGVFVMMMSAVLSFWSEKLFPGPSSFGFTAVLLAVAAGSVIGPVVAGFAAGIFGSAAMFVGAAAISLATLAITLPHFVEERKERNPR